MRPVTRATCRVEVGPEHALEKVTHHGGIDANVLFFAILAKPSGDENGVGVDAFQRHGCCCGVLQIGRHRYNAGLANWPSCQTMYLPAPLNQKRGDGTSESPLAPTASAVFAIIMFLKL